MCKHVIGFKSMVTVFFPFRARQACNQMQFIYRNDTTSTDHDKVSSLVWDKTPFIRRLKEWIQIHNTLRSVRVSGWASAFVLTPGVLSRLLGVIVKGQMWLFIFREGHRVKTNEYTWQQGKWKSVFVQTLR